MFEVIDFGYSGEQNWLLAVITSLLAGAHGARRGERRIRVYAVCVCTLFGTIILRLYIAITSPITRLYFDP